MIPGRLPIHGSPGLTIPTRPKLWTQAVPFEGHERQLGLSVNLSGPERASLASSTLARALTRPVPSRC